MVLYECMSFGVGMYGWEDERKGGRAGEGEREREEGRLRGRLRGREGSIEDINVYHSLCEREKVSVCAGVCVCLCV